MLHTHSVQLNFYNLYQIDLFLFLGSIFYVKILLNLLETDFLLRILAYFLFFDFYDNSIIFHLFAQILLLQ